MLEKENKLHDIDPYILCMRIDNLPITVRSYNCLKRANINNINDYIEFINNQGTPKNIKNLGMRGIEEIHQILYDIGINITKDPNNDEKYIIKSGCDNE